MKKRSVTPRGMRTGIGGALAASCFSLWAGSGCDSQQNVDIAVMPKLVGIDYFNACQRGAQEAADELGLHLLYDGPTTNSAQEQAKIIETWIARRYPVIAVAPNDPDQIAPVLRKARSRGIHVLTYDADAAPDARAFFVNQTPNEAIARTLMDLMAEAIGPQGKYIIITGSLTAANQRIWIGLMEQYREQEYPEMVNLSPEPKPSEEDQALATRVTTDVLKSYSDVQGIFAMTSVALPGAAEALRKQNAADRVYLTGLSTPKAMRSYIKDGTVKEFVLWNPLDLGYLTVHAGKLLLEGRLTPGQTIHAGRLGGIPVGDGKIVLGDPIVFTASNIDDYNF